MNKQVIISNGSGTSGKDTFVEMLNLIKPNIAYKYSSIDLVKKCAEILGWNGGKTEKDRKFLSDLKLLATDYNNAPFNDIKAIVKDFKDNKIETELLFIDIREPDEIDKAVKEFNAISLLVRRKNAPKINSNMADANVENYDYNYIINNDGTLEDLKGQAIIFLKELEETQNG